MEEQPAEERINDSRSEGGSQIIRGDKLPNVDLKNYNTEGKEAHYRQINQIIGTVTERKKIAEESIKKSGDGLHAGSKKLDRQISNGRRIKPSQTGTKQERPKRDARTLPTTLRKDLIKMGANVPER